MRYFLQKIGKWLTNYKLYIALFAITIWLLDVIPGPIPYPFKNNPELQRNIQLVHESISAEMFGIAFTIIFIEMIVTQLENRQKSVVQNRILVRTKKLAETLDYFGLPPFVGEMYYDHLSYFDGDKMASLYMASMDEEGVNQRLEESYFWTSIEFIEDEVEIFSSYEWEKAKLVFYNIYDKARSLLDLFGDYIDQGVIELVMRIEETSEALVAISLERRETALNHEWIEYSRNQNDPEHEMKVNDEYFYGESFVFRDPKTLPLDSHEYFRANLRNLPELLPTLNKLLLALLALGKIVDRPIRREVESD